VQLQEPGQMIFWWIIVIGWCDHGGGRFHRGSQFWKPIKCHGMACGS